jgi:hypothetical protein
MPELNSLSLIADSNLKGYWRLEGNSNATISAINGADTSITYSSANGKFGQGASFNGTTSLVEFNRQATLEFTGDMSYNVWIHTAQATAGAIACNWYGDGSAFYYGWAIVIGYDTAGKISIRSGNGTSGEYATVISNSTVNDDLWHMVTMVKNSGVVSLYIDGVLQSDTTSSVTFQYGANNKLRFGKANHTNASQDYYYDGESDDHSCWDNALTASEILNMYDEGISGYFFQSY